MKVPDTPIDVIKKIESLVKGTGLSPLDLDKAGALVVDGGDKETFLKWSTRFQRLFRYHDLSVLELCDFISEGGMPVAHLLLESQRHEVLSVAYRIMGMAVDAADSHSKIELATPVLAEEFSVLAGGLLVISWAFATKEERKALLAGVFKEAKIDDLARDALLVEPPVEVLDAMSDSAGILEQIAGEIDIDSSVFPRPLYPPTHPATSYNIMAVKES